MKLFYHKNKNDIKLFDLSRKTVKTKIYMLGAQTEFKSMTSWIRPTLTGLSFPYSFLVIYDLVLIFLVIPRFCQFLERGTQILPIIGEVCIDFAKY